MAFGMLFVFYRYFHPWKSEGISVGFTPGREKRENMLENIYDRDEAAQSDLFINPSVPQEPCGT